MRRKIQGYVCSTLKKVRELGLERRETVWSLSTIRVKKLQGKRASMRRMQGDVLFCVGTLRKSVYNELNIFF